MNRIINRWLKGLWLTAILLSACLFYGYSQCPPGTELWNKIIWLRDSSGFSPAAQFKELAPYLENVKACQTSPDSAVVLLYQRLGWLNHSLGNFDQSRQLLERSIYEYKRNGISMKGDRLLIMRSYNNLRICLESLGELNAARAARDSCISIGVREGTGANLVVPLLYSQMTDHFRMGDYYRVLEEAELGEKLTESHKEEIASVDYYLKGFPAEKLNALIFLKKFEEAGQIIKSIIGSLHPGRDDAFLATYYQLYARTVEQYDWKKALSYYEQSFNFYRKTKNTIGCAQTMNNAGFNIFFTLLKDYPGALRYYQRALPFAEGEEVANILQNIANVQLMLGKYDSSLYFFQQAYKHTLGSYEKSQIPFILQELVQKNYSEYLIDLLLSEAEAYRMKYRLLGRKPDLQLAIDNYRLTDRVFSAVQKQQGTLLSRLYLRSMGRRLYEPAIDASLSAYDQESAFYFFEQSRSALLFEQLKEQYMFNPKELGSIHLLKKQIRDLEIQKDTLPPSDKQFTDVNKQLFTLRQNEQTLRENIRRNNPVFFQSQIDSSIVSLKDFRKAFFPANGSFVEMLVGDSAVFVMMVTENEVSVKKISLPEYQTAAEQFIAQVSGVDQQNINYYAFKTASANLFNLIFGSLLLPDGPVVISPGGRYFPFEALIVQQGPGKGKYLLEQHPIYYTYSAAYWMNLFERPAKSTGSILGLAPVTFGIQTGLPALQGSEQSMKNILSHFAQSKGLFNQEASRRNFFKEFSNFQVVQLYSHASDSSERGEPIIWLADSSILLSELINDAQPSCRLILLSACLTANGQAYVGEGVFSFNRGFAALGIPSAIANLWEADSRATYRLTEKFYEFLSKGMNTDEALRQAKLSLLASGDFNLPYYWAAPVLVGRSEKIILEKAGPGMWLYFIAAMVVLMAGVVGWVRKSKVKSQKSKFKSQK